MISYNSGNYMLIVPTSLSKVSCKCEAGYRLCGYRNYQILKEKDWKEFRCIYWNCIKIIIQKI